MGRVGAALSVCLLPTALFAQPGTPEIEARTASGQCFELGMQVVAGVPTGSFGEFVRSGWGFSFAGSWKPAAVPVGLRVETSMLFYGSTRRDVADPKALRCEGDCAVSVDNWIGRLAIGPQVGRHHGNFRPYAYIVAGASYFATTTALHDSAAASYDDGSDVVKSDIACADWTFSWSAGGGLLLRLKQSAFLDLGLHYVRNATVNWLAEGDMTWDGNSVPRVAAHRTPAKLVEITIGVTLSGR
jgi:opacity protein-like surface antigen